ncbi:protein of unknown function [Mesorhizobium albiziae]|uniref:Mo-co oxidoreductase dimerization domain protein n=1 Tax=Neomesorhizobium albiziae TaxID=335020 RepID=A0A1I4B4J3_9HYPH|nr:DUF4082 domain-containing protein [Mesorhizobium albiziae]GLS34283.1 hypothetical protein GCM10007937_59980 [Mesorhizobium albiziae]SFK62971.1 protein of unknown function [Mesorhizobium albiziae]
MLKTDDNKVQGYLSVFGGTAVIYTLASAPKAALVGTDNAGASVADATAPTLLAASQMVTATYQSPQSAGSAPAYVQKSLGLGTELPILGQVLPEDGAAVVPQGVFSSGSVSGDMSGATAGFQAATISAGSAGGVTAAFSPTGGETEFSKAAPSTLLFDSGTQTSTGTPSTPTTATGLLAVPSDSGSTSSDPASSAPASRTSAPAAAGPTGQTTTAALTSTPNKIVLENQKQGTPRSEWGIDGDGDGNIQGFATEISRNVGQTVDFKIATDSTHYKIDIYRLGYYGGDGARKIATIDKTLSSAQIQPHPIVDSARGLIDAGNWGVSASWAIPSDAVSGVYFARLTRLDGTAGESMIPFIVRDDSSTSDIVFQTSDTTWQAYNEWGGASLYFGDVPVDPAHMIGYLPPNCGCGVNSIGRAVAVSYNRPFVTNTSTRGGTHDFIFGVEHSAIRWLEQNGYDVSYISGVDATRSGSLLLNHDAFLSVGHDEYWSAEQRTNVEAARDAGVNLAFWSGNEIYWKVRWETSIDGNGTPYRTMVTYKETWGGTPDPSDVSTGTWRDPRFQDPGQKPENALTGTMFQVDSYRLDTITIPYEYSNLRFWRNTDIANLQPGQTASLVQNLLGYEWDSDVENGFRPAGLINMSLSTVSVDTYLRDYGTSIGPANATHSLTMYRAASGALVFGAGTVFWSWGLDSEHEGAATPTDPNVQQAMVNMFADMGIQPQTLDASLILATQSTDLTKPTSTITSPVLGAHFVEGQRVTITGTAQDSGGGIIAGVEVSTDGGLSWFKATGRETWNFTWIAQATGTYTIRSRAVDDSLNIENVTSSAQVTVTLPSTSSVWTFANKPELETALDRDPVELGMRFQTSASGFVEGIRFYKGFYNIGQHVVSLWNSSGALIATGTSVGETLSGWQTVKFSSPVQISSGTTYIASYHTGGYYSVNDNYFTSPYTNGTLTALGGVYRYTADPSTFPTNSAGNSNYWVDVVFVPEPNQAPVAVNDSGFSVGRGGSLVISFASLTANDTDPNGDALTVTAVSNPSNGTVTLNAQNGTVIFTPNANYSGPASFTYTISDGRGGTSSASAAVTVEQAPPGVSLFQATSAPTGPAAVDGRSLELGMRFSASVTGEVTAIRFYKMASDTGPHTGSLWTSTGTLLGTVTFTNESISGWQTAKFTSPVQLTAGASYVVSYHSSGTYAADANYFTNSVTNGPLTAPSSAGGGGNGLYAYGTGNLFPTSTYNATNYWVDVVFNQSTVNVAPVANNDNGFTVTQNTPISLAAASLLSNDNDANGDPLTITGADNAINGSVSFNSQTNQVTFTPTTGYAGSASFRYTISDGRGGTSSATVSLNVTPPDTTVSLFSTSNTPSQLSVNDPGSVELGVRFTVSAAGMITGMRYYKSAQDTGTHVGSLWTTSGTLLTSATFTAETGSGWQTVTFAQPIAVSAGTSYVASYHSNGFYAASPNYFTSSHTNGPLTAPASVSGAGNGLYRYGTGSLFPTSTYNATNYWVDVIFDPATQNMVPVANNDTGFTSRYQTPLAIQGSALLANDTDADADPLVITGVTNAVGGTVAFDGPSNVVTFTPAAGFSGNASFTYSVSDGEGGTASAQVSLNITPPDAPQSLFTAADTPSTVTVNDSSPVTLGMKFTTNAAGWITGFKFYKGPNNTGPHQAHLWTSTGTLLANATFTNETASGWQSVDLAQPVAVDAGATYVVSYHTNGFYSATSNFFNTARSSGNLTAPSGALSGGNGVYAYGASGLFPTNSYNNSNYYVDVAFKPQLAA